MIVTTAAIDKIAQQPSTGKYNIRPCTQALGQIHAYGRDTAAVCGDWPVAKAHRLWCVQAPTALHDWGASALRQETL